LYCSPCLAPGFEPEGFWKQYSLHSDSCVVYNGMTSSFPTGLDSDSCWPLSADNFYWTWLSTAIILLLPALHLSFAEPLSGFWTLRMCFRWCPLTLSFIFKGPQHLLPESIAFLIPFYLRCRQWKFYRVAFSVALSCSHSPTPSLKGAGYDILRFIASL
jgi:hypothetical protein